MKYGINQLPGELSYRTFLNNLEIKRQKSYRAYQDWRMKIGIPMGDIDAIVSDQSIESFGSMINQECSTINQECLVYAILEMKHWRTKHETIMNIVNGPNPSKTVANKANLSFFIIKYYPPEENTNNRWEFTVYPSNQPGQNFLNKITHMSEKEYVEFLYRLRGQTASGSLLSECCNEKSYVPDL